MRTEVEDVTYQGCSSRLEVCLHGLLLFNLMPLVHASDGSSWPGGPQSQAHLVSLEASPQALPCYGPGPMRGTLASVPGGASALLYLTLHSPPLLSPSLSLSFFLFCF